MITVSGVRSSWLSRDRYSPLARLAACAASRAASTRLSVRLRSVASRTTPMDSSARPNLTRDEAQSTGTS